MDARTFLDGILYTREEVDAWLSERAFPFAKYDSELGWLLRDAEFRDGLDDSISRYTYGAHDERITISYRDRPCRINTYGNSFTQCHQVSDGETWQEVLAAHLGEPVRNFGVGGWSAYQAYLRMLREEARVPAEYIVFNIYDDDHFRNLDAWRNIRTKKHDRFIEPTLPHVVVNASEDAFLECANPCPTPESVHNLCDLDWVHDRFRDDFALHIVLAHANARDANPSRSYADLLDLATTHGIKTRIDSSGELDRAANDLHRRSALYASQRIVEKVDEFARQNDRKVLYVLSYGAHAIARYVVEGVRDDAAFLDFLSRKGLPVVDLMEAHADDWARSRLPVEEHLKRYFVGHYNPLGNFFCAHAIKDRLVEMLDPKPPAYR